MIEYAARISIIVAGLVAAAVYFVLWDPGYLGNDAAQYIAGARYIAAGDGYLTDLIYYETHYAAGTLPAPQTVFPPGYSLAIAAISSVGFGGTASLLTVNMIGIALLPVATYHAARQVGSAVIESAVSAILLSSMALVFSNSLLGNSELIFTVLSVGSLWAVARGFSGSGRTWPWMLLAGLFASACFAVRYQGLFLVLSFAAVFGVRWLIDRNAIRFLDGIAFALAPVVVGTALVYRNFRLAGNAMGGPGSDAEYLSSITDVAITAYWEASRLFGFSAERLESFGVAELLLLVAIGLTAVIVLQLTQSRQRSVPVAEAVQSPAMWMAVAYLFTTALLLGWLAMTRSIAYMQARYLLPLLPLVVIILARLLTAIRAKAARAKWAAIIAWLAAFIAGQANAYFEQFSVLSVLRNDFYVIEAGINTKLPGAGARSVFDLLREEQSAGRPIFAFESQRTGLFLSGPTLGATPGRYTSRNFDLETVLCISADYNARYILVFPGLFDPEEPRNASRRAFAQLQGQPLPAAVTLVAEGDGFALYRMAEGACADRRRNAI